MVMLDGSIRLYSIHLLLTSMWSCASWSPVMPSVNSLYFTAPSGSGSPARWGWMGASLVSPLLSLISAKFREETKSLTSSVVVNKNRSMEKTMSTHIGPLCSMLCMD